MQHKTMSNHTNSKSVHKELQTTGRSKRIDKELETSKSFSFCRLLNKTLIIIPIFFIVFYKKCISPLLPPSCKYTPTCSTYAIEALKEHGFFKGSLLSIWRIMRCNPYSKGGYDPVPKRKK